MKSPARLRVFFDTNVVLSAFITEGTCRRLLRLARAREIAGIVSSQVIEETERHLRTTFEFTAADATEAMRVVRQVFESVETPDDIRSVCRDPTDDAILAAALNAKTEVLVTGDQDLLVLCGAGPIRILPPADLLRELEAVR
ncbi:MAG: putative toxin-antitoxin system toxin component, PIN family [Nitrospirae bacterium]|nr:putative toxin-antitoxin system toxin component, PIN family [Nitrospirota bacterium]